MILVDTSVWIDHLRGGAPHLAWLLQDGQVLLHPWVIGELALGRLSRREEILGLLRNLPRVKTATAGEVLTLIDSRQLFGLGIGYVDVHLLAATMLTPGTVLWTRDKRLAEVASHCGIASESGQAS